MVHYKNKHFVENKGVSYIELILIITIIAVLGMLASPFYTNFVIRNNFETTVDKTIGVIRKAQNYAMDGKDDTIWGVCLSGDNLRLYSGSCNSPDFSEDFNVSGSVNITGLNDTSFSGLRGEPLAPLSITISTNLDSKEIRINQAGGMEII